jgi:hypothetical protein
VVVLKADRSVSILPQQIDVNPKLLVTCPTSYLLILRELDRQVDPPLVRDGHFAADVSHQEEQEAAHSGIGNYFHRPGSGTQQGLGSNAQRRSCSWKHCLANTNGDGRSHSLLGDTDGDGR